jgi:hypothetical protein
MLLLSFENFANDSEKKLRKKSTNNLGVIIAGNRIFLLYLFVNIRHFLISDYILTFVTLLSKQSTPALSPKLRFRISIKTNQLFYLYSL